MSSQTTQWRNTNNPPERLFGGIGCLTRSEQIRIVRGYLKQLNNGVLLLVCHLYLHGHDDAVVCKTMHLTQRGLEEQKQSIADGILTYMNSGVL